MKSIKSVNDKKILSPPMETSSGVESLNCALAENLARKQLEEGTASSQVITHYLKLSSSKERLEKEILELQKELISAKADAIRSSQKNSEDYELVINAIKGYTGEVTDEEIDEIDEDDW